MQMQYRFAVTSGSPSRSLKTAKELIRFRPILLFISKGRVKRFLGSTQYLFSAQNGFFVDFPWQKGHAILYTPYVELETTFYCIWNRPVDSR